MNMKKYILSSIILLLAAANTAWGQSYVAEISGGDQYATLEGAFNAAITANANKTITLLADCEVTSTITVDNGMSLTLDLAGHTVSSAISTTFKVSKGTLIVNDNGATKGGIMVTGEAFRVDSRNSGVTSATGAMLTINSGVNVTSIGDACIFIREYATVNTSGNLTSNGQYATIQGNGSDQATTCNVTISGGSVTATQSSGVYFPQNGTLTVSGGIVTGNESGIAIKSGTLNVTGGTIHCTGPDTTPTSGWSNGVNASGCAIQIESNNGYGNVSVSISGTPTITSDNGIAVYEYIGGGNNTQLQSLTISGGTFTSGTGKQPLMLSQEAATANAAAVSGGTFTSTVPQEFCATGYVPTTADGGMFTVQLGNYVAKIETTPYATLVEAITAATSGQTIELLKNIDLGTSYYVIINKAVTIDGNNYTITGSGTSATNTDATIVLQGSGDITLTNLKVTNPSNNGVGIKGTSYSGTLTINNCVITAEKRGINVGSIANGFSMIITGSTIQSNVDDPTTTYATGVDSRGISFSNDVQSTDETNITITGTTIQGFRYDIYVDETKQNLNLTMTGGAIYGNVAICDNGESNTFTLSGVAIHGLGSTAYLLNLDEGSTVDLISGTTYSGGALILSTNNDYAEVTNNTITLDGATKTSLSNVIVTPLTTVSSGDKYQIALASASTGVAKIGNVNYATLQAAINAAVTASITASGEEIIVELLKDVTDGTGLALFNTAKGDYPAANGANVKIDFGGHTYKVAGPAVGSTNTQNQVLHFESGNTVTLTNGTINVTTDATALAAFQMFMQNYGTLTIDKMNLDGTGIAVATYSGYSAPWEGTTKPQFNYNTAGSSVIRNSTITMPGALGIDNAAALTIEDDAVINVSAIATKGTDDRYSSATATVTVENGAKFKLTDTSNAAAFETLLNANGQSLGTAVNGVYTVETATFVASITAGGTTTNYTSLESALTAAYSDGTITLLKDVEFAGGWTNAGVNPNHENNGYSSWKLTIDGDGYKITPATGASTEFVFSFNLYNKVDFKDVVFDGWTSNNVLVFTGGTVSLDGVTITNTVNSASGSSLGLIRTDNADFTATNCSFTNNTCAMVIGVNIVTGGGDVTITNNLFSGNTCDAPGVVYFNKNTSGTKSLTNNTFIDNTVTTSGNGSVVYCSGTVNAMTGNLFSSNNVSVPADKKEGVIVCGSGAGNSVINSNAFDSNTLGTTATHYATIYTSANIDVSNNYWGGAAASESDIYNPDSKTITNTNYATAYAANTESNGATVTLASVYVAQVGETKYETLQEAINAAVTASKTSGNEVTVTLLTDVTNGTGLALFKNATGTYPAANGANVKIDFGGHTYTVAGPAVGSTNTQNQVLHFEQGNTITLTNGTINMTNDATALAGFEMFMQNYGTLIIDGMSLDGTGIAVATYSGYSAPWEGTAKPQFNYNTAGNSVIRNSTITMTGDLGIDDAAGLTIEDDAVINVNKIVTKGTDARYASATPTIEVETGAKFKLTDASNAAAFETLLNANGQSLGTAVNGVYTVETATFVASITAGGTTTNYTTLQAAIDAVTDGGTITLLADVATPRYNLETKSFTVNLNGKTLSSTDTTDDGIIFCPKNGKTITIDGTTASSKVVGTIMLTSNQVGHIVINGGTYENNLYTPIYVNGNASNTSTVSITDATVIGNRIDTDSDVETGFGMYLAGPATVTVTNTNVTAVRTGIEVRAGSLTVDGGSITSTATSFNENANGNGGTIIGAAVAISQHNTNKAITVNLNSGTYSGCYAVYEHDVQSTTAGEQVAINITGGDYTGTSGTAIMIKDVDTPTATVPVTAAISGGTFNSAVPNNYCATNYIPAGPFANGKYSVELNNATSINEATITVSVESATYIGSAITPIVTVKNGDTPLVKDTDYTILFDGTYTNAKTYNNAIIITGIGNYRDTRKSNFVISPRNINDVTVSGNSKIYRETGYSVDDIKGSIGLTYTYNTTSNPLTVGETNDYTITVDDTKTYKTPGTYTGVITLTAVEGEGKNYTGSRTVDFMIGNATDIANCDITVPTIIYNGKEQLPAANVTVKNGSTTLTNNADYEISFANGSNFTNAGTTQITITGKGDSYYGSKTVNYTIERRDIATCSINNSTLFGDGSVKDPAAIVTITYNNGTETLNLVKATENALNDYTITVSAGYVYQEPRTYTGALTITGNGNYKGTVTKDFVINNNDNPALNLATALVTSTAIYNGAQQVPSANNVVVKIANQVVDPTNYVVTYTGEAADYKDAKTYAHAVVITATGSAYYGKLTADYVIAKRDMLNVVAAETAEMKWTGNPITPNINTDDNKNISLTLTTGPDGNQVVYPLVAADYTYTTQPAVIQEPGLYTFTFEGRGNFTGTKTLQNVRVLKNMDTQGGNIKLDLADSRIILPATIPPATESAKITAADITVKDGATVLTQGVDYSATIYSKVTEDDQHNFTFNDADIVAEIQNDPDNGKDDGIYWLKITGLNNSYEQSKTLKFYVLKEYYEWNSASISSNYSIHLTDAQNASVGALVVNNTTDPVTVENCNAVATGLATLTIEPTMNITLKDGQGSGSKSESITVKITDIEPNAFDGCSSLSSLDASKLVGFTPNSLNRNSKGTTFYGIAKQALIYLNGTTFKGENYVYTPDPNPSDNSQYFCELFKIYDDFSGSQTGFTGNDYRWDLISQHGFTAYTIENMRQFAEGRHYTVCLPYSIPIPKNVKAYTLDATSDKLFGFKEVGTGTLNAYTPYVLIPSTSGQLLSTINVYVPSISSGTQFHPTQAGNYTLYGTMSYMDGATAQDKYIMQYNNGNPTWKKITSNSSYSNGACILPMRAYIMSNTSGSREFFDVVFTNIDGTTLTFDKVTFDDDTIYDLSGRRVELLERGHTYIINGKKVIVK